ncbi:hypothetical protein AMAG_11153 [Allomyces macrogynus ATCC 38327]|uniref:Uncharacterized protein n=1 Tax=Allomyces macrogynus (strain ATCC 38327) TaxID=578462 RepID=A0A0L0ST32_ALLM3|nr:hypothetical protein AMAG_11153 [Allomyces macrogynus ATCC 38327]|eukprot:KNE65540.1 hypothetical protein AMAG_11153 [Allomyces macrogynus ATCC 38327]
MASTCSSARPVDADSAAELVLRARNLYMHQDVAGALHAIAPVVQHAPTSPAHRDAWRIYFACRARSGHVVTVAEFRKARDESLLPLLLLGRTPDDQCALLADLIPELTDVRVKHEAMDVWWNLVQSTAKSPDDVHRILGQVDWLDDDDKALRLKSLPTSPSTSSSTATGTGAGAPPSPRAPSATHSPVPTSSAAGPVRRRPHAVEVAFDNMLRHLRDTMASLNANVRAALAKYLPAWMDPAVATSLLGLLAVFVTVRWLVQRSRAAGGQPVVAFEAVLAVLARVRAFVTQYMTFV